MADRYDLVAPRKGKDGRSFFTKIGVMFANRNGDGFSLSFEALPITSLNDQGQPEVRVLAMVPRSNDARGNSRPAADDLNDDVPF